MKKVLLASLTLMVVSSHALAATTGTLLLKGQVGQVLSISVAAEAIASTLPLDVTQQNTKVATINEKSNSSTGYKVKITSANLGNLKRTSGTELFPYSLKYSGTQVNLAGSQTFSFPTSATVDVNKDVSVSYTGVPASSMIAGEYVDTVTFEIAAN